MYLPHRHPGKRHCPRLRRCSYLRKHQWQCGLRPSQCAHAAETQLWSPPPWSQFLHAGILSPDYLIPPPSLQTNPPPRNSAIKSHAGRPHPSKPLLTDHPPINKRRFYRCPEPSRLPPAYKIRDLFLLRSAPPIRPFSATRSSNFRIPSPDLQNLTASLPRLVSKRGARSPIDKYN